MKQYIFFILALIVLTSTFVEAGKGKEILQNMKESFSKAGSKIKAGLKKIASVSHLACPFVEKFCEDHCESKNQVGKCDDFKCSCVQAP
uniref:BetaSPN-type CS-alpha/beta domain-containing protein n=1 Tax=Isometrus maculatus TaxID=497827 RepID=A0A0U1TZ95_ISOMC|nr:hypothetical protein [Isometrus maculatus]